jgi:hypothetical protein
MFSSLINRSKFISNIEASIEVEAMNKEGLDYWPIAKLLFFTFERKPIRNGFLKISYEIYRNLKSLIYIFKPSPFNEKNLGSIDLLFFSANSYREDIFGKSYNKFFEEAIQYFVINNFKVLEIDYSSSSSMLPYENKNSLIFINRIPQKYLFRSEIKYSENEYRIFEKFASFLNVDLRVFLDILTIEIRSVISWKRYYLNILAQLKPKYLIISCYYSLPMFGLIAAAHELKILTIDFQHGGQGEAHPCYYYDRPIVKKLNTLPNHFGVWDDKSYRLIDNWANYFHNVYLIRNPWHSFITKKFSSIKFNEKYILFTLTLERSNILPDYIIEAVRNTDVIWYFRFHPRTPEVDKLWVVNTIESLKIKNVKYDLANSVPLPILLINCDALVSQSSGSIAEAVILNVHNIIVTDELGHNFYKDEINSNKVIKFEANRQLLSEVVIRKSTKSKCLIKSNELIEHINSNFFST